MIRKKYLSGAPVLIGLAFVLLSSGLAHGQSFAGEIDPAFAAGNGGGTINTMAVQSDGKILIGGPFSTFEGVPRKRIARVNTDGTLDDTFAPLLGFGPDPGADSQVRDIVVQPDGKILVIGDFTTYEGNSAQHIIRLADDGSVEASFNFGTGLPDGGKYNSIGLQSDGKILIGGTFNGYNGQFPSGSENLYRLLPDGTLDLSFQASADVALSGSEVYEIVVLADDAILVSVRVGCCQYRVQKLLPDGSLDNSFNHPNFDVDAPYALALQADGRILVGGSFNLVNDVVPAHGIVRLLADGSVDGSFDAGSGADGAAVKAILVQPDGKILVGGTFDSLEDETHSRLARLLADGSVDHFFGDDDDDGFNSSGDVFDLAFSDQFAIYAAGSFTDYDDITVNRLVRLKNFIVLVTSVTPADDVCIGSDVTVEFTIYPTTGFDPGNNFYLWAGTDIVSPENYFFGYTAQTASPQTFQIPVDATPGEMYFIVSTDAPDVLIDFGSVFGPVTLIEYVEPSVDIDFDDNDICLGATLQFTALPTNGGTAPIYDWFVNGISMGVNSATFSSNQFSDGDEVWATMASSEQCPFPTVVQAPTIDLTLNPSTSSITSNVTLDGAPVDGMEVFIFSTHSIPGNLSFTDFYSLPTEVSGDVTFTGVWPGTYMLKAAPNISQVIDENILSTWHPQSIGWVWADEITVGCSTVISNADISLYHPQIANPIGVNVSGYVRYGQGRAFEGDPIPGVPIIIMKDTVNSQSAPINNQPLITRFTSDAPIGTYTFESLPTGDYRIYVDMPGLPIVATHFFTISTGQTEFPNLDFCVDTTSGIWTGCQIEDNVLEFDRGRLRVFPNPFLNQTEIILPEGLDARQLNRAIFTADGRLIRPRTEVVGPNRILWDMANLPAGFYHFVLWNDNERFTGKLMKE